MSGGTDVIPLYERSSAPACVGQEPVRTSCAPAWSPLKVQPPKATVQRTDVHVTGPEYARSVLPCVTLIGVQFFSWLFSK